MAEYMWAVQDGDGREVLSWRTAEVAKVSDVHAERSDGKVRLLHRKTTVAEADDPGPGVDMSLHRWAVDAENPSGWKTAKPQSDVIPQAAG